LSSNDRSTILHEFGHALGMLHELQSPARGGTIHLNEFAVYRYYRSMLRNRDDLVKSQIIDVYNLSQVANFSRLDLKSIMMYFMPAKLNKEGIDIPPNLGLSGLDKAYIVLNYPGNSLSKTTLDDAMKIAGVIGTTADEIKTYVAEKKYTEARDRFCEYNKSTMESFAANSTLFGEAVVVVSTAIAALGTDNEAVDAIVRQPDFQAVLATIVKQVLLEHGIGTAKQLPKNIGTSYVSNIVDTLLTGGAVGELVEKIVNDFELFKDAK